MNNSDAPNTLNTIRDVLLAVDQKLSDESKWTKGWYAKDKDGMKCWEKSPDAVCHCLIGAIVAVTTVAVKGPAIASDIGSKTIKFLHVLSPYTNKTLHEWNDAPERTFQDVKNLIAKALTLT